MLFLVDFFILVKYKYQERTFSTGEIILSESNLIQTIASIEFRLGAAEDLTSLLSTILEESIRLTNCDGGSLYLLKDDHLGSKGKKSLSEYHWWRHMIL